MSVHNILVCDDDKDIVNALEIYLKQEGYSVFKAYDGNDVLKLIDEVDITDKKINLRFVRQKIGLVFQYPEHQLFEESVQKDVAFGPKNMGLSESPFKCWISVDFPDPVWPMSPTNSPSLISRDTLSKALYSNGVPGK
jgi:CheY-like chemotaxis protein